MTWRTLLPGAVLSALLLATLPLPAAARDGGGFAQERGRDERQFSPDRRDDRRDAGRGAPSSPQKLSPDERRQLRQDLHDANRDMPRRRGADKR
jgi:hypothetical protein